MITYDTADQDALAVRAQAGDQAAWSALYASLDRLVWRKARGAALVYGTPHLEEDMHAASWSAICRYTIPNYDAARGHVRSQAARMATLAACRVARVWLASAAHVSLDALDAPLPSPALTAEQVLLGETNERPNYDREVRRVRASLRDRRGRIALGRALIDARAQFPSTGRYAGAWSQALRALRLDRNSARHLMQIAREGDA